MGTELANTRPFYGRRQEVEEFRQLFRKTTSSLVVISGRRRVGKTTLVKKCAERADHFLAFEGLAPHAGMSNARQLAYFAKQLAAQTHLPEMTLSSWPQAFQLLAVALPRNGWTVVLFDEVSWMARFDPDFPGYLKSAWDNWLKPHPKLILVLCGSVSSWIERNILQNTGFVGRPSLRIRLEPLSLPECAEFWGARASRVSALDKLKVLCVTGGVPRYLEEMDPSLGAEENIHRLCFRKEGILYNEFDDIVRDLFEKRAPESSDILRRLVDGPKSLSQISQLMGVSRSGHLGQRLEELALAGFIRRDTVVDPITLRNTRFQRYRLCDNYFRFYLKYVEPERRNIEQGFFERVSLEQLPDWETIIGLQFENLVLNNLALLRPRLGLANTRILAASPFFQKATVRKEACQVDLLLRTKYAVYVVEIKCRRAIPAAVMEEVREKVRRLKLPRELSVRTALVYEGQLNPAIGREGYFDFLVPFAELLEAS